MNPAAPDATPPATARRSRTVAAAATAKSPLTAAAEPARKTVRKSAPAEDPATRRPAARKSTAAADTGETPVKPAAVKSTSSRTTTGRSPARKTATVKAPVEPDPETAVRPARRRTAATTEPASPGGRVAGAASQGEARVRRTPAPEDLEAPAGGEAGSAPAEMTRGILELAAERLAASKPRPAEPEPSRPAADDPMAAPGGYVNPRGAGARRSSRSTASGPGFRAVPGAARPGSAGRPPLTSRPLAGPPEVESGQWDGLSAGNGWLGGPGFPERPERGDESGFVDRPGSHRGFADRGPDVSPEAAAPGAELADVAAENGYPKIRNRPGLPPSLRLPVELPDNLWPPRNLLERNLAENIHVPAPVPPMVEDSEPGHEAPEARTPAGAAPASVEAVTEERPGMAVREPDEHERIYVPAAERHRPRVDTLPEAEPEHHDFLPSVMSRGDSDAEYVPAHSRTDPPARHAAPETTTTRRVRWRRRAVLVAYLLLVIAVLVAGHELRNEEQPVAPGRETAQRAAEPAEIRPAPAVTGAAPMKTGDSETVAAAKPGEFGYANTRGPVLGTGGRLYRFRVAVEETVEGTSPGEFAEAIDDTLGDERSWINKGRLRLRRVPKAGADADFTVYLASAKTSERMCAAGGLDTEGYTSCRVPGQVVINADRWDGAVPDYDGKLDVYRRYTINHEVGHELGHGHEACPGKGEPAPVMQQQTFGLKGCTANAWPYLDGKRYAGKPIA
ncbi:DUF3152 domain-containing protein [Actinoplanes utahensis]|uniref:DUF3152 domain-containing protein n=1 Tax=Actinoplanes utahensis TaxID=1869 RepID=UPI0006905B27|nr:DUF3152 domain-containing protein [Actinoplanes utahensis]